MTSTSDNVAVRGMESLSENNVRFGDFKYRLISMENQFSRLEEFVNEFAHAWLPVLDWFQGFEDDVHSAMAVMRTEIGRVDGEVKTIAEEVRARLTLCERALANGGGSQGSAKIKIPKPKAFTGKCDPKVIDNFLWQVEQYFNASKLTSEEAKVSTASMFLAKDAVLWWRRRTSGEQGDEAPVDTLEDFKREFQRHFFPEDVDYQARKELRALRQKGTIREYVQALTSLMLCIPRMSDEDRLFSFLGGLKPWAETELRRREVKSLAVAIAMTEKLIEYERKSEGNAAQPSKGNNYNGQKKKKKPEKERERTEPSDTRHTNSKKKDDIGKSFKRPLKCFICEWKHMARDCPKKKLLNAAQFESKEEEPRMGALSLLNVVCSKEPKVSVKVARPNRNLIYLDVLINGFQVKATVDTWATHNFVSEEEARRLKLKATRDRSRMKAVKSTVRQVSRVAKVVSASIGEWGGKLNFTIVPMDDFKVIIGMDFLTTCEAFILPSLGVVGILDEGGACMINGFKTNVIDNVKSISALQLKRGLKQGYSTYLAVFCEVKEDVAQVIHKEMMGVLNEFKDVMPKELPPCLPPRRGVDHKIELEPGVKPSSNAP
ncbi:uncharacterized protein [Aristolochia californica]|uniref:uncharacterized protein n=1 Tax=Aristolochia californica TaxID=171875 RepID=UPI0035D9F59F